MLLYTYDMAKTETTLWKQKVSKFLYLTFYECLGFFSDFWTCIRHAIPNSTVLNVIFFKFFLMLSFSYNDDILISDEYAKIRTKKNFEMYLYIIRRTNIFASIVKLSLFNVDLWTNFFNIIIRFWKFIWATPRMYSLWDSLGVYNIHCNEIKW